MLTSAVVIAVLGMVCVLAHPVMEAASKPVVLSGIVEGDAAMTSFAHITAFNKRTGTVLGRVIADSKGEFK